MKDFFKTIFEYHHHYNQALAGQFLQNLHNIPEEPQKLFSHVLNAHQIWNARIIGAPSFQVWQEHTPQAYKQLDAENYTATLDILGQKDLLSTISYTNSKGESFSNTVQDILFHINNHSTYHKGQLASHMKALGITPLVTDYIFFRRD